MRLPLNKPVVFTVFISLASLLFWVLFWQFPVLVRDDYYFMSRSGLPYGGTNLSALTTHLFADVTQRNGRIADLFVQVILSLGMPGARFVMALIIWCFPIVFSIFTVSTLQRQTERGWFLLASVIGGNALPFYLMSRTPLLSGSLFYFISATVGYVGGVLLLAAVVFLLTEAHREGISSNRTNVLAGSAVVLGFVAAWFHESIALALIGLALAMIGLSVQPAYFQAKKSVVAASVLLIAICGIRLRAPGLLARTAILGRADMEIIERAYAAVRALYEFADTHYVAIFVFSLLLGWLAQIRFKRGILSSLPPCVAFVWIMAALLLEAYGLNWSDLSGAGIIKRVFLLASVGTFGVTFFIITIGLLAFLCFGHKPFLPSNLFGIFGACIGGFGTAVISGTGVSRPAFFGIVFFYVSTAILISQAAFHSNSNHKRASNKLVSAVCLAVVGGLVLIAAPTAKDHLYGVRANAIVWRNAVHALVDGEVEPGDTIVLPRKLPRPDLTEWVPEHPYVTDGIRQYYSVPHSVHIDWE